jgi:hypothetical protein
MAVVVVAGLLTGVAMTVASGRPLGTATASSCRVTDALVSDKACARSVDMKQTPALRSGSMDITRVGSQASVKGSGDYFTGTVRVDPLFQAPAPARVSGAAVMFEPGAHTAWHTHPLGQTLVVTAGVAAYRADKRYETCVRSVAHRVYVTALP